MNRLAPLLVVALLAVFSAWSALQAAGAATMTLEMAGSAHGVASHQVDCAGCDADRLAGKSAVECHTICNSPVVADLADASAIWSPPAIPHIPSSDRVLLAGRTCSPDPYPPRSRLA